MRKTADGTSWHHQDQLPFLMLSINLTPSTTDWNISEEISPRSSFINRSGLARSDKTTGNSYLNA